jgi:hypothetical protein
MKGLLRSRKFWLSVVAVVEIIVLESIGLDPAVWATIAAIIGTLVGAIAWEDTAKSKSGI